MHNEGCKQVAFYTSVKPEYGGLINATDITLLTGKHPRTGDYIRCGYCKEAFIPNYQDADFVEVGVKDE